MAKNLYIVDNMSERKSVKQYLADWCAISKQMDVAAGYFDIGGLLAIDQHRQKLEKMRIILGDEVTLRTQNALEEAVNRFVEGMERFVHSRKSSSKLWLNYTPGFRHYILGAIADYRLAVIEADGKRSQEALMR